MLDQVVMLEENRELVQDQALKHEGSRELIYQSDDLVKKMETIFTAKTEYSCLLTFTIFKTKFSFLSHVPT